MVIALFQMSIVWEDRNKNYEKLTAQMVLCKEQGVDLLLLPEMSFTGFSMNTEKTAEYNKESLEIVKNLAIINNISIGFGWVEKGVSKALNHYTIVGKNGEMISDYVKIHPFSFSREDEWFEGGNRITEFMLDEFCFSNVICYDLRFPELFRCMSKEVEAVIIPANWPDKRVSHWDVLLKARAIENQIYVIAINCAGNIGDLDYSGHSVIINPNGETVLPRYTEDDLIIYDIINDVSKYREKFPVKNDRRDELYFRLKMDKELI